MTLFTLAIFLGSIWSLAFYVQRVLHQDMQHVLGEQQFSTITLLGQEINHELSDRLEALEKVAAGFNPEALAHPQALQDNLSRRPVFLGEFNGGVFVTGLDGVALASEPQSVQRTGFSYLDRDYVADAIKQGRATIGSPVMGRKLSQPILGMAAPIRDAQGKVIGVVAGVTNLGAPNFLTELMASRYGKTGGYVLIAPQSRLIVAATDKSLIMQPAPALPVSPVVDGRVQSEERTVIGTNSAGIESLTSKTPIPAAGWELRVSLPTDEAFAPIRAMQVRLRLAALVLTLVAGGLIWWMLKRQLAPMLAASRALSAATDTDRAWQALPVVRQDEVGRLIAGFNRLLAELGQREALLKQVLNTSSVAIFLVDRQGRISQANDRMAAMFGYPPETLLGHDYFSLVDPAEREAARQKSQELLASGIPALDTDRMYLRRDGSNFWGHLSATRFVDAQGQEQGLLGVIVDITERKQGEEIVRQLAYYDPLTNLANRLLMRDRLTQCMLAGKRNGNHGALLFMDLDNFKPVNDTYGHGVGDSLLVEVARRLTHLVRQSDTVARFGGDEFVVLLDDLSHDVAQAQAQAETLAHKIRMSLAEPYVLRLTPSGAFPPRSFEHRCSASIGVALFLGMELSDDEVIKRADLAMYQAKEAGRNLVRFYDPKADLTGGGLPPARHE